jgi:hypothetical protein
LRYKIKRIIIYDWGAWHRHIGAPNPEIAPPPPLFLRVEAWSRGAAKPSVWTTALQKLRTLRGIPTCRRSTHKANSPWHATPTPTPTPHAIGGKHRWRGASEAGLHCTSTPPLRVAYWLAPPANSGASRDAPKYSATTSPPNATETNTRAKRREPERQTERGEKLICPS